MPEKHSFAEHIKAYRIRLDYTQEEAAQALGYSKATVAAWESERRFPSHNEITRLASLLNVDQQTLTQSIKVRRAEAYTHKKQIGNNEADKEITFDMTVSEILDRAETIITLAWNAWFAAKPGQATKEIYRLIPQLEQMLNNPALPRYASRIRELLLRSHGLLGTMRIDALQNNDALYHLTQAHRLATEMHDLDQAVTYIALIGDALRRQGNKGKATHVMEEALEQAVNAQKVTRGNILQLLAYTYADTGRAEEFERTVDTASDLLVFSGEGKDIARKEFNPFELYEIRGKGNRDLGKPTEALRYLYLAEQSLHTEVIPPRWYALLDISKGQAYCDIGDLQNGIALASQGFLRAYQCHSLRQMHRVRKLLKKLEASAQQGDKLVKELREMLYETYAKLELEG